MALQFANNVSRSQVKPVASTREGVVTRAMPHPSTETALLNTQPGRWASGLALAAVMTITQPHAALADQQSAELAFTNTCAGCHAGGGNIVNRSATLKLEDLTKYGIDSVDELYKVIYSGRGSMPGYGVDCAPKGACTFGKRLADEEVEDLAEYVLNQAKAGWQQQ